MLVSLDYWNIGLKFPADSWFEYLTAVQEGDVVMLGHCCGAICHLPMLTVFATGLASSDLQVSLTLALSFLA